MTTTLIPGGRETQRGWDDGPQAGSSQEPHRSTLFVSSPGGRGKHTPFRPDSPFVGWLAVSLTQDHTAIFYLLSSIFHLHPSSRHLLPSRPAPLGRCPCLCGCSGRSECGGGDGSSFTSHCAAGERLRLATHHSQEGRWKMADGSWRMGIWERRRELAGASQRHLRQQISKSADQQMGKYLFHAERRLPHTYVHAVVPRVLSTTADRSVAPLFLSRLFPQRDETTLQPGL